MYFNNIYKIFIWLSLGLCSVFFIDPNDVEPYKISLIYLGICIIIHGLISFYRHGGDFITPTGFYMLVSVVLSGVPSIYINFIGSYYIVLGHFIATLVSFICQVLIYHIFGNERRSIKVCTKELKEISISKELYDWTLLLGIFLMLGGIIISQVSSALSFFLEASVYVGIVIIAISLFRTGGKGYGLNKVLVVIALFGCNYFFLFEGFGRINLATLLLALVICYNHRLNRKILKVLISIGTLPALIIASLMRGGSLQDISAGMGSIISPFYRFGQLVELYNENIIDLYWGKTIWAAIVTPIPRDLWPSKPWNFNREITYIFKPEYVAYGHSEASVLYAECFFNFGYLGLILGILFIGFLLKFLDSNYLRMIETANLWSKPDFLKYLVTIIVTVGMLDLYWGGFSTFMAREGFRLIVLLILLTIMYIYIPDFKNSRKKLITFKKRV